MLREVKVKAMVAEGVRDITIMIVVELKAEHPTAPIPEVGAHEGEAEICMEGGMVRRI